MSILTKKVNTRLGCLLIVLAVAFYVLFPVRLRIGFYKNWDKTFEGDSNLLETTQVVPSLDTPIEDGKNVIWCASFIDAWKRIETDVLHSQVELSGATQEWKRLNDAPDPTTYLPDGGSFSRAGLLEEGIVETIRDEMANRFPEIPVPDLSDSGRSGILAYSFLHSGVHFTPPYFEHDEAFRFTDSQGNETPVRGYGISRDEDSSYYGVRKQVQVLYCDYTKENIGKPESFALNLAGKSETDEVIVCRIPMGRSLAEMLHTMNEKIQSDTAKPTTWFGPSDTLHAPDINFKISHRFQELEGTTIVAPALFKGLPLVLALQDIEFKLDRSGATLTSSVVLHFLAGPTQYRLDKPFLICLRRRGVEHPYFVMWVENAELLRKWKD